MNKKEFDAIVDDAVKNGADRKDAETYVDAGYKLDGRHLRKSKSSGKTKAKRKTAAKKGKVARRT